MNPTPSPRDIAAALPELWSPRVIAEVDDNYVKVARVQGVFGWHDHAGDEVHAHTRSIAEQLPPA